MKHKWTQTSATPPGDDINLPNVHLSGLLWLYTSGIREDQIQVNIFSTVLKGHRSKKLKFRRICNSKNNYIIKMTMIAGFKKSCLLFSIHKKLASWMKWQDSNTLAAQMEEAVIALLLRVRLCCLLPRIQPALLRVPWQISLLFILKISMKNKNSYFEKCFFFCWNQRLFPSFCLMLRHFLLSSPALAASALWVTFMLSVSAASL